MKPTPLITLMGIALLAQAGTAAIPDGYELKWADEFEVPGAPNPEYWTHELGAGGWGNGEDQFYTDELENSRVENGHLIIEARQFFEGRSPGYTSARLVTRDKVSWKYGRMEIKAKIPDETGTWPAIWMLSQDRLHGEDLWPDNGEIDIMEHVGYEVDPIFLQTIGVNQLQNIHGTIHTQKWNGLNNGQIGGKTYVGDASTDFHVYAINWTEDRLEWEVDGAVYFSQDKADLLAGRTPPPEWEVWPFSQRYYLILNIAIGGDWGGHFNSNIYPNDSPYGTNGVDDDGVWPQRMEIDYVRVYAPAAETTPVPGRVLATDLDDGPGVVIQQSENSEVSHNLTSIESGDFAEFVLDVPQAGQYTVSASVASESASAQFGLQAIETSSSITGVDVPQTGGQQTWQSVEAGTLNLQQGLNTLRLSTTTGGFNVAYLDIAAATGGTWKGLPMDAFGNVDTNTWLGRINVQNEPWIYVYSTDAFIYMTNLQEDTFEAGNQWIYFPKI
jgi:beta-glucanase (GH16 family)